MDGGLVPIYLLNSPATLTSTTHDTIEEFNVDSKVEYKCSRGSSGI